MRALSAVLTVMFVCSSWAGIQYSLVEAPITSKTTLTDVQSLGMDIVRYDRTQNLLELVTTPADEEKLALGGIGFRVLVEDLEDFYASRLNPTEPMGGYHTYSEAVAEINLLHSSFPNIVGTPFSIGPSIQGNELWVVKISDNPEIDENEPEVFYNGLIHAREPMSLENLLYFMHYLTDNYPQNPEVAFLVENREMFFLPIINPDGYLYNESIRPSGGGVWRKNMRDNNNSNTFEPEYDGVDLNRNFSYMWGYDSLGSSPDPGSETYRGIGPFSEPETQRVRDFVNSREFTIALNYHSYGNLYVHAWSYDYFLYTPDHDLFSELGWELSAFNGYIVGPGWMNLYTTNGGANDWMYGDTLHARLFSYVVEIAAWQQGGFWPPENLIIPLCQDQLGSNLLVAEYADDPYRTLPPNAPVVTALDTLTAPFTLTWNPNTDPSNPPAAYDIAELRGRSVVENALETNPAAEWALDGFVWSASRSHSSSHSLWSNAVNNSVMRATVLEIYHANPGDTLFFWTYYNIEEDFDYGYVMISRDGGYIYETLEGSVTTNNNPYGANFGNGITGNSNGWIRASFDLSQYTGDDILISFVYVTDYFTLNEGWFIDDIYPWVSFGSNVLLAQSHPDTFINVDPGNIRETVYYRVRALDGEVDISPWSPLEDAVVIPAGIADENLRLPRKFHFIGVNPNPFNSAAILEFSLADRAPTRVSLYNAAGKLVENIDLGTLPPGLHTCQIDGSGLASGIYFVRLLSGSDSSLRKIVLLK